MVKESLAQEYFNNMKNMLRIDESYHHRKITAPSDPF
jgi:hypothetical protein